MKIFDQITALLQAAGAQFRHVHHQPTRTSEESAQARGEDIRIGAKALLIKTDDVFRLFVLSAALRLDSDAVKHQLIVKKTRFATPEELLAQTGLVPGSVPPFGRPILPYDLHIDDSIFANERVAFNAGSLTDSLILATADYVRIAGGQRFLFSASERKA